MAGINTVIKVGEPRQASGNKPSGGPVYGHVEAKDGYPGFEDVATLYELFERSVKLYGDKPCLGTRSVDAAGKAGDFEFETYQAVAEKVKNISSGLRQLGMNAGACVGVFGPNCPEWMVAMQACNRGSNICVPLYDSLGENAVEYIINHSGSVATFVAGKKLPQLAKALDKVKDVLKHIVYWGNADAGVVESAKSLGFVVHSFDELLQLGAQNPTDAVPPKPEDLSTIMYTSGTTGDPKGVMLTHKSIVAVVYSLERAMATASKPLTSDGRVLSYLPLAHIFDRSTEELFLYAGASIGYWRGDVNQLVDDVAALKPTLFIAVPRVFDRIYSRINAQVNSASFIRKSLFGWAYRRKLYFMKQGLEHDKAAPLFDKIVFSKIKARLGGEVQLLVSGGAPLAPHVEEFLRVTMCCDVVQGYGLTETCAGSFISDGSWPSLGSVGGPLVNTQFFLESVPDMDYDALDPTRPAGEVVIKSPQMFKGYYKNPKQTEEVLEPDGWFHTGDIATFENGNLRIIDRKKNIFKLSQGEYIAVEKLEGTYKKNSLVEQVWVYGNSFKNSLVGVVVPVQAALEAWAKQQGITFSNFSELCAHPKAREYVLSELVATGKGEKLKGFEILKAVTLDSQMWSVESDLLTPTFKLKRNKLQQQYQMEIDSMYASLGE